MNSKVTPAMNEELITSYQKEYTRTTGKTIEVEYNRGWFIVGTIAKWRRKQVQEAIQRLLERPTVIDRMENVNGVPTLIKAHEHVVQNLLSGKDVVEDLDTPSYCSVSSEAYWSM
jgi:hypothetical protein